MSVPCHHRSVLEIAGPPSWARQRRVVHSLINLVAFLQLLVLAFPVPAQTIPGSTVGFLHYCVDGQTVCEPWVPAEGDIVLLSHRSLSINYLLDRSSHPAHSGLIVRTPTGNLAFLEVGGGEDGRVVTRPIAYRLSKYLQTHESTVLWVRRIKRDVTLEESVRITRFAEAQLGKKFAKWCRFLLMGLPFRPMPKTRPDQNEWFCSELVVEAIREGRLIDDRTNPSRLTPYDVLHDKRIDLSPLWGPAEQWTPIARLPTERPAFAEPPAGQ